MMDLTYSNLQKFKDCRKKFYWRVMRRLGTKAPSENLFIGSLVHKGLEVLNLKGNTLIAIDEVWKDMDAQLLAAGKFPNSQEDMDMVTGLKYKLEAMITAYFDRYQDQDAFGTTDGLAEFKFNLDFNNPKGNKVRLFRVAGKMDRVRVIDNQLWLYEYKSASKVPEVNLLKLMLDFQVTLYLWALRKMMPERQIAGVKYRYLKKTAIRKGQAEPMQSYRDRLIAAYRDPDMMIERIVYRSNEELDALERELFEISRDLMSCMKSDQWYKNTSQCTGWGGCEYLPLCTASKETLDDVIKAMFKEEKINIELEDGNGDNT